MATYPHEQDPDFVLLVVQFEKDNDRKPNDLDKMILTQLWAKKMSIEEKRWP